VKLAEHGAKPEPVLNSVSDGHVLSFSRGQGLRGLFL
jgi:hypothetical protein